MELVSLERNQILFEAGQLLTHVYYPVGALISMINDMPDGSSVETHMLGMSSMVGIGAIGIPSFYRAKVRFSGLAYRLPMHSLYTACVECPTYVRNAQKATQRILMQLSQAVVCSKKHTVDQQLVRWILLALDNTLSPTIAMTHQELSDLLGCRREAISLAMNRLSETALISKSRGEFTVISRKKLETASCDCYWIGQEKVRPAEHGTQHECRFS